MAVEDGGSGSSSRAEVDRVRLLLKRIASTKNYGMQVNVKRELLTLEGIL